ncbi:cytochrome-c peroxidase [Winogradskyella luteola]|uniref:Cytochrome-c peroxidase n=1 Tax=Winogradskyella luteola TaxID=2828330 RepID=A0A9X1FBP6_9FLAO|nr:cytochrome c peroxidase [Winogradskyella luteola]MBV7269750.1 cytochrome-c peroxidase [Winogradskyella luteola]
MKNLSIKPFILLTAFIVTSCHSDKDDYENVSSTLELENRIIELYGSTSELIQPLETDYLSIPSDINNPITEAKVQLGKLLYHETMIALNPNADAGMYTYSCASCHHADAGFQSGLKQGIGDGGLGFGTHGEGRIKNPMYTDADLDVQPIRTPTTLNVAFQKVMLWNGQFGALGPNEGTGSQWTAGTPKETNNLGFEGVEIQAIAGLDVHRLQINADDIINSSYKNLFDTAFSEMAESERYTKLNAALAIAAYERTLLPNQSPFQKWLRGDADAMEQEEVAGAKLFFDKAQCYTCHSGPGLNGMDFHALGMNDLEGADVFNAVDMATRKGRGGFTGNPEDDFKFKTPQLYNLKDVQFFGHGGSFQTIKDVIEYKNTAVAENGMVPQNQLSSLFVELNLTETEIDQLTVFLEKSLYDNNLSRYVPESIPSGNCFPNADYMSSSDLGCE